MCIIAGLQEVGGTAAFLHFVLYTALEHEALGTVLESRVLLSLLLNLFNLAGCTAPERPGDRS